jgi:hypothetical protein
MSMDVSQSTNSPNLSRGILTDPALNSDVPKKKVRFNLEMDTDRAAKATNMTSESMWNADAERGFSILITQISLAQLINGKMTGVVLAAIKEGAKEFGDLERCV